MTRRDIEEALAWVIAAIVAVAIVVCSLAGILWVIFRVVYFMGTGEV